jgi:Tfp pilus assembly protein PilX
MTSRLNRRGASLPLTIIVLAIMAVAVAISFARLSSERRISGDTQAQIDAMAVAQSGINRFLSTLNGKPAVPGTWPGNPVIQTVTYNDLPGGTARVDLAMLRDSTPTTMPLPAIYVITSRGTATGAMRYDARSPAAQRTVATYALWTPAPFDMDAAVTSLGGMDKAGGSGTMNGNDACGVAPPIPGVAVASGSGVVGSGAPGPTNYTGATGPIDGSPDNSPLNMGTSGPGGTAKDQVDVDWAGITTGTVLPAAYTYPAWPGAGSPGMADWPVIRVNNNPGADFNLPGTGQGILIVTGNLVIGGSDTWQGLILVGGTVRSNGSNDVRGAVVAGLNVKLGQIVGQSQMNGTKSYRYDSCALSRALGRIGSIQRVRNGWTDSWSSY